MKYLKIIWTILFFNAATVNAVAQNDSAFSFLTTITGNYSYFNVDNLGNIYLITNGSRLKKLNEKGDSVSVFNDVKRFGNPSSIDVTNPMKVLLYYQHFSTVIILDRLLNIRNIIDFRKQQIFSVKSIATSYDNNIWLFDEQDYTLKKIDDEGKILQQTIDWRILFDTLPSPVQITDASNYVYLYDTSKGFYVFDYYGGFKNKLSFLQWKNVEVSGNKLYGFSNNSLFSYDPAMFTLKEYKLPAIFGKYHAIKVINAKVYLLKEDGIHIYQVK